MDEGRVAKQLRNKGGFVGQPTLGLKTWVMLVMELEREEMPRHETGRCFVCLLPNRRQESFEAALRPRLKVPSLCWSDDFKSYNFLDADGHVHESVVHSRGEFKRVRGFKRALKPKGKQPKGRQANTGRGTKALRVQKATNRRLLMKLSQEREAARRKPVRLRSKQRIGISTSSNGAEGGISRMRTSFRCSNVRARKPSQYGPHLAEFAWRVRNLHRTRIGAKARIHKAPERSPKYGKHKSAQQIIHLQGSSGAKYR